jgi:hypothetical protein
MIGWELAAAFLAAASSVPDTEAPAQPMPSWMTGLWRSQTPEGEWAEEWWTTARAGQMLGAGRSGKAETLEFWEQTRIERTADGLQFCASTFGKGPGTCFKAVSATDSEIAFENPAHDYPRRIVYRREGNELFATISGPNGSKPQSWRFKRAN